MLTIKNRSSRSLSDYKEEKEAKKSTRKIDKFETKIKNIRELIIDPIKHDYDLNIEKGLEIERIKKIETKLEKIKLS